MDNGIAKNVLNAALATGADFAELYVQNKTAYTVELNYKRVDNVSSRLIYGAGIRLMRGLRQVYGYTSDLSEQSLTALAQKLAASFDGKRAIKIDAFEEIENKNLHAPKKEHATLTTAEKIEYLKRGEAAMYATSPLVINARCATAESDEFVEIFTATEKKCKVVRDRRVRTRVMAIAVASDKGEFQTGTFTPGLSKGAEFYAETDFVAGAKQAAEDAVALLSAPECPSGNMPVIIGNKFGGVLFHEACGHPLEGTAISHNTSPFAGKIGQKIASDIVTAIDDGTVEHGWGSENFDDEGEPSTRNVLIKNGVLTSYMIDTFDGRRMNAKPTGACRRESYKYLPTTRMTNTYIAAGESTPEEIIKATEYGLYCVAFNGGSVNPTTDKFNFTSSKTYIVKNGKLDTLVKAACLVGYGYDILPKIDMVGNDAALAACRCGAASGSVAAAVGHPTLRVSAMPVGRRS
ncbi:MAG: TldD/PmbA family protein, partial [Clostridiales bacterium]|nr:TldD/PmbA family protein [Clostridiales bacterium]